MLKNISMYMYMYLFMLLFSFFLLWNKLFFNFFMFIEIFEKNWMNMKYIFYMDSIAIFFMILSMFMLMLCIMFYWYLNYKLSLYLILIFISIFCLMNIFLMMDIFILFIFFELIVLPLFLIMGIWGSRESKMYATYLLFIYTLISSMFILFSFLILYFNKGSFNFFYLNNCIFLEKYQLFFMLLLFFSFSMKMPMMPLHMWLPEAHVEAPVMGSVMLASIMLKLSVYVYLRLLMFMFIYIIYYMNNMFYLFIFLSMYMASFSALAQLDMKKMIAYSSMVHMNFSLMGLFCNNMMTMLGTFFMLFGHAFVSGALFFCMGVLYESYKTRLILYYSGLVLMMPMWSILFFFFMLGNFSLPGTMNFVGEFIIFFGSFFMNNFIIICLMYGLFLSLIYSIFLLNKLIYGLLKMDFMKFFSEMSSSEFYMLFILLNLILYFGVFPNLMFDYSFNSMFFWFF